MIKLKNQVCSFDLAKRLEGHSVPQDSYFYWVDFPKEAGGPSLRIYSDCGFRETNIGHFSAFNVTELYEIFFDLGLRLPNDLKPANLADYLAESISFSMSPKNK